METTYAELLIDYCLEITPGDKLYVDTTTLALPLVEEVYRIALQRGAHVEVDLNWDGKARTLLAEASDEQLSYLPLLKQEAMQSFDAYLAIRAPFNARAMQDAPADRQRVRAAAMKPINDAYFRRSGSRELRRTLCQYPTQAAAHLAGMSLADYKQFVYTACKLNSHTPRAAWLQVRERQEAVVQRLNLGKRVRYQGPGIDISFSTEGRTWINSDGRTNMPSGEVYTSPVEDSVNGTIRFDYPAVYRGHEVEGVTLWVEAGEVVRFEASRGLEFLARTLDSPGARRFGEAAIGTNYSIDRFTGNILFDEKIGGTVHMALGQSYPQAGGRNTSAVHWDMIAGMRDGGEVHVDGELVYRDGKFLNFEL